MKELFTREVYEAAQAYRHAPAHNLELVKDRYEAMVYIIAKTAIKSQVKPLATVHRRETEIVERLFAYYKEKIGKSQVYTLTHHRRNKGHARLRNCLKKTKGNWEAAEELMKICIDTMAESKFHMGENDARQMYNDWENQLFSSEEKMEKWLERAQR